MLKHITLFLLILAGQTARAQEVLHIFYTGDIRGVLKSEAPERQGDILRLEAALRRWRAMADRAGRPALVFDTGDAFGYHYLSQLDSGRTVLRHMLLAGYDATVPGNFDLSYGVEHLRQLDGRDSLFSFLTTNVLSGEKKPLLTPVRVIERGGIRVAVLGLVDEEVNEQLLNSRRQSIRIRPPAEALQPLVDSLRARCALIVALSHMDADDNIALCRRVSGIDLIISKPADDSLSHLRLYDAADRTRTLIVNAPPDALAVGHLTAEFRPTGQKAVLADLAVRPPLEPAEITDDTVGQADYARLDSAFQTQLAKKYDGLTPDQPLAEAAPGAEPELMEFALYTLLHSTHSEIALLNNGALRFSRLDLAKGHLTPRDLASLTLTDNPVVTMRLSGKSIKAILSRARTFPGSASASLRAMAVKDYAESLPAELKPHGLPIDDNEIYAVATTLFLAEGGDGYAEFLKGTHRRRFFTGTTRLLSSEEEGRLVPLDELMIRFLADGNHPDFTTAGAFYDQARFLNKPLVLVRFENMDFAFKSVRVSNNENFTNANDKRVSAATQNATNIAASGYLALVRRTRRTRWENGALVRYAFQEIGSSDFQESDDRLELQTILDWDDPFNWYRKPGRFNLYTSLRYDTEFTPATDADLQTKPRRQDGYFYLGVSRFGQLGRELRLAFFAKEDFASGDQNAGFELNLKYFNDFRLFRHGSLLRGRFLFNQPGRLPGDERALLDYTGFLEFNIINFISLKPQINLFIFQDMALKEVATNVQFSVNLSFTRLWKPQYIRFWRKDRS